MKQNVDRPGLVGLLQRTYGGIRSSTDGRRIDAALARVTTNERADVLRFVACAERCGHLSPEQADEWRRRIAALRALLALDSDTDVLN